MNKTVKFRFDPSDQTMLMAGLVVINIIAQLSAKAHEIGTISYFPWNAGIAIGSVLATQIGPRSAPVIFTVSLAAAALRGGLSVLGWEHIVNGSIEALACIAAASILRSRNGTLDFNRVRNITRLFAAAVLAALITASGTLLYPWESVQPTAALAKVFACYFLSALTALLLIAPFFLLPVWKRQDSQQISFRSVETLLQVLALSLVSWEVLGRFANEEIHFFYLLFLPLSWIATRHGQRGAAFALGTMFLAALISDWLFHHRDQAIIELQVRLSVLGITGLLIGAMGSERRMAQERMLARQAELAHIQRLNVGWEMASALAHELSQPLTASMNYSQAALRMISKDQYDKKNLSFAIQKSIDQIERISQIIHGLKNFMKKGELQLTKTDVADTVEDAIRLVASEAVVANVVISREEFSSLPPVLADKTQLVQILVNLIRNSIQALSIMPSGSGIVTIAARQVGGTVEIVIADNGPGVAPEIRERLFVPFSTTKASGMGLGLSISRSLVEAHQGRLILEDRASGGAAFCMTLPIAERSEGHVRHNN